MITSIAIVLVIGLVNPTGKKKQMKRSKLQLCSISFPLLKLI